MKTLRPLIPIALALAALGVAIWWPSLVPEAWRAAVGWFVLTGASVAIMALFVLSLLANGMRS